MALLAHSGTYDHLYQTVALAASGAAMGFEVHIFLSFWALRRLAKEDADRVDVPAYAAAHREALERGRREARLPPLRKMLEDAKSVGPVTVYACSTSMKLFGVTEAEARKVADEVLGTAAFLDRAQGAEVFLFI
jgi:peroxiredoxin family protein